MPSHLDIESKILPLVSGFHITYFEYDGGTDFGSIVQIIEQQNDELHAIFLTEGGAQCFKGRVDGASKMIQFEALFPDLKQPKILIIDFFRVF